MSDPTNEDRAGWGALGLQAFRDQVCHLPEDRDLSSVHNFEEALGDMLDNLMHYARQQALVSQMTMEGERTENESILDIFERAVQRGFSYYEEELAEERWDESHCDCGNELLPQHDSLLCPECTGDAPDCSRCGASNAGARQAPYLCEPCDEDSKPRSPHAAPDRWLVDPEG